MTATQRSLASTDGVESTQPWPRVVYSKHLNISHQGERVTWSNWEGATIVERSHRREFSERPQGLDVPGPDEKSLQPSQLVLSSSCSSHDGQAPDSVDNNETGCINTAQTSVHSILEFGTVNFPLKEAWRQFSSDPPRRPSESAFRARSCRRRSTGHSVDRLDCDFHSREPPQEFSFCSHHTVR